jgi:hypothetical protein
MRASKSEPTIKGPRFNIGNGYGQYCVLDDPYINPIVSPRSSGKIKLNIVTPNSSDSELSESECPKPNKKTNTKGETFRNKIFVVGVYLTTAAVIAFEYWYCFKK